MNFIATAISVGTGVTSLFWLLHLSSQTGILAAMKQGAQVTGLEFVGFLFAIVLATFVVAGLAWVTAMAVALRIVKGPNRIKWVPPTACSRLAYWVSCEWDFYGKHGRDKGIRFLGLELLLIRPNVSK